MKSIVCFKQLNNKSKTSVIAPHTVLELEWVDSTHRKLHPTNVGTAVSPVAISARLHRHTRGIRRFCAQSVTTPPTVLELEWVDSTHQKLHHTNMGTAVPPVEISARLHRHTMAFSQTPKPRRGVSPRRGYGAPTKSSKTKPRASKTSKAHRPGRQGELAR